MAQITVERRSGSRVTFQTLCFNSASGETLVEGTALALIRPVDAASAAAAREAPIDTGPASGEGAGST